MKVDWNKIYCGLNAKDMRKFLINLRRVNLDNPKRTKEQILQTYEIFKLQPRLSKINFVKSLIEEGFILKQKQHYVLANKAVGFSNSKCIKRITKTKAKSIVDDLVNRAIEINSNDYYLGNVKSIKIFGSYINSNMKDCGDIDVIVDIKRKKNVSFEQGVYISYKRTKNKVLNLIDRQGYAEYIEPLKYLKNRNKYISFCHDNPSDHNHKTIYEYKG